MAVRRARRLARPLAAIAIALVVLLGLRSLSKRFVFPTHRVALRALPEGFRLITAAAPDGVVVHALDLPGPPGARTVVHFHNNRETMADGAELARALHLRGLGVLLVEYRGYGLSNAGDPSEEGLYSDAEAALDQLSRRGVGAERVVLFGASLGTGVAAEMARRGRGAALVLVTPYTSIPDVASDAVPLLPARLFIPDRFDTLAKSPQIRVPTLVIHGDADEIVPFWMGDALARTIEGARLLRVAGGRHGDLFARDRDRLVAEIASFARPTPHSL